MSRRIEVLTAQVSRAYVLAREARKLRNSLRDDYLQLLAAAEADLQEYVAERDDALARLNARLVAEGLPTTTLDAFKDLP
jgi:1,6-anhydro-N-acetylmuramate kinase